MSTPLAAVAAAAAAIGAFCGFDSHYHQSDRHNENPHSHFHQNSEVNGKSRELAVDGKGMPSKVRRLSPVFAPEFDGLHCYETLVG